MSERVILITGTSKGIGMALAQYFLAQGDIVVGCSRSLPEWADPALYPNYKHFQADVSQEGQIREVFIFLRKIYGKLDALINNAGVAAMNHSLLTPADSLHRVLDTNTVGTFLCCREAAKLMRKSKSGRIVNFSTVAVPLKLAGEAVYAASKAAIVTLTQILAKEYGEYGITVNAIGPTPVQTDLIKGVTTDKLERLLTHQAIRRYGTYEDIENVVEFYLRPESNFITGQVIYLGGL